MWSISKTENNFYGKKIWDNAVANNPGSNQGKYTFLYAILQLYKSQFEEFCVYQNSSEI